MPTANELPDFYQIMTIFMDQYISCTNETFETFFGTTPLDIANALRHLLATGFKFYFFLFFLNHISILPPLPILSPP